MYYTRIIQSVLQESSDELRVKLDPSYEPSTMERGQKHCLLKCFDFII